MTVALPTASEITAALIAREELPPEKGDIGPQGLQGPDGQFGPPGPQGPKGDQGRNGVDGAPGDLGPIGPQGKQGDRGLKGDKGDKGDEGDRGEQGPIGPTGASGSGRSFFPRGGGGSSGSGLPSGGTVGQVVTNTGPGAGDWEDAAGGFPNATGSGSPVGTIDPTAQTPGYTYLDTTNGALYMVVDAIGTKEWNLVGGEVNAALDAQGIVLGNGFAMVSKSIVGVQLIITDIDAYNNSGNGIKWIGTGVDGEQSIEVRTGPTGDQRLTFSPNGMSIRQADIDLSTSTGNIYTGTTLPTVDPAVAGQVWSDDGTLVLSGSLGGGTSSFLSIAKWT